MKEQKMARIRVVSFDMDGTITDLSFVNSVWLEGIPRLYAIKNGVSFEDAKTHVKREYEKVGRERLEWYDPNYWTKRFGLDVSSEEVLGSFQHRIRVFPEVNGVLEECKDKGFRLIIVTNSRREFVNLELERTNIGHYFERVFSATSDFGLIKKTVNLYRKVCSTIGVSPGEMAHVGDDRIFDFVVPSKLGIKAFYLDRTGENSGESVIPNLAVFIRKLESSFFETIIRKKPLC
jgi:putative hydrolase of the HAD superfamily